MGPTFNILFSKSVNFLKRVNRSKDYPIQTRKFRDSLDTIGKFEDLLVIFKI